LDALESLTMLDLYSNQISKIEGLNALKSLTELGLDSNQISKIEGLDALKSLTALNQDRRLGRIGEFNCVWAC